VAAEYKIGREAEDCQSRAALGHPTNHIKSQWKIGTFTIITDLILPAISLLLRFLQKCALGSIVHPHHYVPRLRIGTTQIIIPGEEKPWRGEIGLGSEDWQFVLSAISAAGQVGH
jgi:hypothetical protein